MDKSSDQKRPKYLQDSSVLYRLVEDTIEQSGWKITGGDEGDHDIYLEVPELKLGIEVRINDKKPTACTPTGYHLVSIVADCHIHQRINEALEIRAIELRSGEVGEV